MANKLVTNKVYKCQAAAIASASIHVIGGSCKIKGSNVIRTISCKGHWNATIPYTQGAVVELKNKYFYVKQDVRGVEPNLNVAEDDNYKIITKDEVKAGLLIPTIAELVDTGDELEEGIHIVAGLPEWFAFEGTATEIWVKMAIEIKVTPGEEE